jgi:SAM-dependent methyltransferase
VRPKVQPATAPMPETPIPACAVPASLLDAACEPYRKAGRFAYYFARGKLTADPVYRAILELGLLSGRGRILDLGCGQGLLAAWLQAARRSFESGAWPQDWPAAPTPQSTRGIELMPKDVERAHRALGPGGVSQGDIRVAEFGAADAVVILDVLHFMPADAQRKVLLRVRAALPARGLLLLRVGDSGGGLRFRHTQWVDRLAMLLRGHAIMTAHWRSVAEWLELLRECGFEVEAQPMSEGTRFANVLLIALAS